MRTVAEIKQDILELPKAEYAKLRDWLLEEDWERWDRQIEEDAKSGKLDFLKEKALEAKRNGTLGYL
jgi:hypothetical protein